MEAAGLLDSPAFGILPDSATYRIMAALRAVIVLMSGGPCS